jgi:4-hydroxy-3-methylbut-2-en-1-yl diphosphate reductase
MQIVLARPRGFCAGVTRAIEIVERALAIHGAPVYVFHEIVHNGHVVGDLERQGAVFVDDIAAIPRGAVTVFSAHGVAADVERQARQRDLEVIDATCPLVAKVHLHVQRFARQGLPVVLIGHAGHDEVVGTVGKVREHVHIVGSIADVEQLPLPPGTVIGYVTQTTLSVDDTREIIAALARRYPELQGPELDDICYATHNRQQAVKQIAGDVDLMLVVGAANSSNSHRLQEVAAHCGCAAHLVDDAGAIDPAWFAGANRVGVTAGASAPEYLVDGVIQRLRELGASSQIEMGTLVENVTFRLPAAVLRKHVRRPAEPQQAIAQQPVYAGVL